MLGISIQEKVNLTVQLHDNNYFKNKTIEELQYVDKRIRPIKRVTQEYFTKHRSTRALNKKFSWIMKNLDQPFAQEFADNLSKNAFKSVKKVQLEAAKIFKVQNSSEYNENKATVSTQLLDGIQTKVVKKNTASL
jgi:hypothetical protein